MNISVCMIVKNEEADLAASLQSVQKYSDDIVVVDTGSTDRTKEIAQQYTDRVLDYAWHDDFAAARNFAIDSAKNDWVLILDADERVTRFNAKSVNKLEKTPKVLGRAKVVSRFSEDGSDTPDATYMVRVFNRQHYHYDGVVHEQVVPRTDIPRKLQELDIVVEHDGYLPSHIEGKQKMERNQRLLQAAIREEGEQPYLLFQLGRTYVTLGQHKQAAELFQKALAREPDKRKEYVHDAVQSLGFALINDGRAREALALAEYEPMLGRSANYRFMMAHVYMNNAQFDRAVQLFQSCVGDKTATKEGINSYLSYYNIGVIYEVSGNIEEARAYYERCGAYAPARERLAQM